MSEPKDIAVTFETLNETKKRIKRICDDLERSADSMPEDNPYGTASRIAINAVSSALQAEFLT